MCVTGERGQKVMQITDVRVRKVAKEGKLKAVVSITMDEEFVVHDIKVIEGEKGLFIAMPSKRALDGEYRDIAHPIIPVQETESRRSFWTSMRKYWKRLTTRKLQKSKYRKILKTKIPETGSKTSSPGFLYFEK